MTAETMTRPQAPTRVSESPKVQAPTWAALKAAYKGAEGRGVKARGAAYDAITRAFALTSETESDKAGAVSARSEASRAREVIDAFRIESGNVFGLSPMRIAQVVKVYKATARAGLDPFSEGGRAVFTALDQVRKFDNDALNKVADQVKGSPDKADQILADAVDAAKEASKARKARKALKASAPQNKPIQVTGIPGVTAFAEAALGVVRKESATATPDEKAAARKALEALLAHLA